jgi:hypothetical protein
MLALFMLCFISEDFLPLQCFVEQTSFDTLLLNYQHTQLTSFDTLDQTKCMQISKNENYFNFLIISCGMNYMEPKTTFQITWDNIPTNVDISLSKYRNLEPHVVIQNFGYASSFSFFEESSNILHLHLKMIPPKNCKQEAVEAVNRNFIGTAVSQLFLRMITG